MSVLGGCHGTPEAIVWLNLELPPRLEENWLLLSRRNRNRDFQFGPS